MLLFTEIFIRQCVTLMQVINGAKKKEKKMNKALELGRMKWMSDNQKLPQDSDVEYHLICQQIEKMYPSIRLQKKNLTPNLSGWWIKFSRKFYFQIMFTWKW